MNRMAAISSALERLRPAPYRGDVTAAGAIPLALSAIVIDLRMTQWSVGARLAVVALIALLILTMGWLTPLDGPAPTQYHSMLLIAGLLPLLLALQLLAEALGSERPPGAGGQMWTFGVEAAVAGADREPGPAYIGLVLLLAFALLVGIPTINGASLIGWPLFLLALGVVGLVIGLRPSTPAPPPPPTAVAPTIPLGRDGS